MADLYALTSSPLPKTQQGADSSFSIRLLSDHERIAIEDHFFNANQKIELPSSTTAVIVPQNQTDKATLEEFAVLVEFTLGVLTVSGFQSVTTVAVLNATSCTDALQRSYPDANDQATFARKVVKGAASAWLRYLFIARNKAWGPHALSQGLREYRGSFRTRVAKFLAQSGSGTGIAGSDFAYETIIHDHFFNSE